MSELDLGTGDRRDGLAPDANPAAAEPVAPLTPTLLARLFVVPAILVSLLVLGLMSVIVFFGWPSIGQRPAVSKLLDDIEGGSGARQLGVALLPRDKDVWLAAQELAERLKNRDKELKPDEIQPAADRLARLYGRIAATGTLDDTQRMLGVFTLTAISRLGTSTAADTLISALDSTTPEIRQAGLSGLVEMHEHPAARASVPSIVRLLSDPVPEVQLVACAALGQVAPAGDTVAISALTPKLDEDREQQWNAALALGRLGSLRGKTTLMSMLDRQYWETQRVKYTDNGQSIDIPLAPTRVDGYLIAAIDASVRLADADLRGAIETLTRDSSLAVRQRAIDALQTG